MNNNAIIPINTPTTYKASFRDKINQSSKFWDALLWITIVVSVIFSAVYVGFLFLGITINEGYPTQIKKISAIIHVAPAAVVLILANIQFVPIIRERWIQWHRYFGYTILVLTPISTIGSIMICFAGPHGGRVVAVTGLYVSIYWLITLFIGFKRITEKNVISHKEWMIRFFALAYAIVLMRPAVLIFANLFGWNMETALATGITSTWILCLIAVELYLQYTRVPVNQTNSAVIHGSDVYVTYCEDYVALPLLSKQKITCDTSIFTFQLPHPSMKLSVPPGHHVLMRLMVNGKSVIRPYTPVDRGNAGVVEFAIKRYDNGQLSKQLHDNVALGCTVDIKGPIGTYLLRPNEFTSINMIAGGSGITPILSVVQSVLGNGYDNTTVRLLYFSNSETDIILQNTLEGLANQHADRFKLTLVVTKASASWTGEKGRISYELASSYIPECHKDQHQVLICGPQGMASASIQIMKKLGYKRHNMFAFGISDY